MNGIPFRKRADHGKPELKEIFEYLFPSDTGVGFQEVVGPIVSESERFASESLSVDLSIKVKQVREGAFAFR